MRRRIPHRQPVLPVACQVLAWFCLATTVALILRYGLGALPSQVRYLNSLGRPDLLLHAMAFAGLALMAFTLLGRRWRVGLAVVGFGALLEVIQMFVPQRQASLLDLAADAVGVALVAVMLPLLQCGVIALTVWWQRPGANEQAAVLASRP